jgi:hypothetical protein
VPLLDNLERAENPEFGARSHYPERER